MMLLVAHLLAFWKKTQ